MTPRNAAATDELRCGACGRPMVVNRDGTANHLFEIDEAPDGAIDETGVGAVDHDADEDHVAFVEPPDDATQEPLDER